MCDHRSHCGGKAPLFGSRSCIVVDYDTVSAEACAIVRQVAALCGGELLGGAVGSTSVSLVPGALTGGFHTANTRTAGSCMLLAQARLTDGRSQWHRSTAHVAHGS